MTDDRVIGRDGQLPWNHPEDMKHFVRTTRGHAVIMGRATYDSMGEPLRGRRNIVLSRQPGLAIEGCEVTSDIETAIAKARETDETPFVIGGAGIYEAALPHATRIYLTVIHESHEGDTLFPVLDASEWVETDRRESGPLSFVTLDRR